LGEESLIIYLSFNAHGVGGTSKILSLKMLVQVFSPYVIIIQETICVGVKATNSFHPWLKDWSFSYVDVEGFSGGLLMV
jgi:hypothetical protein